MAKNSFAGYRITENLDIYVTRTSLPNNTVINSVQDLRDRGITETHICGSINRVFESAEIVTLRCEKRGRYVLVHQYSGTKFILCEVIVIGHRYIGSYIYVLNKFHRGYTYTCTVITRS